MTVHPQDLSKAPRAPAACRSGLRARVAAAVALACAAPLAIAQIGMSQLRIGELPVTLVYPTATAASTLSQGPFTLEVATDAQPTAGPHRLVVLSHGTGGNPLVDHTLAATLARAGFVVAQPQHAGDNYTDTSRAGPAAWITRPLEVSRVLDGLAELPRWKAVLRLDRVGVHGMSAGGVTALSLAGAQWSVLNLARHCQAQGDADLGFCFNGVTDTTAQAARRAQYESSRGVPEAYLPAAVKQLHGGRTPDQPAGDPRPDTRIASVSLAVPVAAPFSADSLARIRLPVGIVTAGLDTMLPTDLHAGHVLRHCTGCRVLADLKGAAHMDLLSPWPADVAAQEAARQPRGGAPAPGFLPRERDAAFRAIAEFHRRHLGD